MKCVNSMISLPNLAKTRILIFGVQSIEALSVWMELLLSCKMGATSSCWSLYRLHISCTNWNSFGQHFELFSSFPTIDWLVYHRNLISIHESYEYIDGTIVLTKLVLHIQITVMLRTKVATANNVSHKYHFLCVAYVHIVVYSLVYGWAKWRIRLFHIQNMWFIMQTFPYELFTLFTHGKQTCRWYTCWTKARGSGSSIQKNDGKFLAGIATASVCEMHVQKCENRCLCCHLWMVHRHYPMSHWNRNNICAHVATCKLYTQQNKTHPCVPTLKVSSSRRHTPAEKVDKKKHSYVQLKSKTSVWYT